MEAVSPRVILNPAFLPDIWDPPHPQQERHTPAGLGFSLDFGGLVGFSRHSAHGEVEGEDTKSPLSSEPDPDFSLGASISCDPRNANVGKRGDGTNLNPEFIPRFNDS